VGFSPRDKRAASRPARAKSNFGAQAGFAKLSSAITQGGFGKVRKATETPFNMILEASA
jgi:hypothetical protein